MARITKPKGVTDEQILKAMFPVLKAPSLREVAKKVGVKVNSIFARMPRLIKEGKVQKVGNKYLLIEPIEHLDFKKDGTGEILEEE